MRRFLIINSKKFAGAAELHYNDKGTLCKIDLTQCEMEEMVVQHFKQSAPSTLNKLISGHAFTNETTVVEGDYEVTFEMFWLAYDKKINKKRCEKIWETMSKVKQVKAHYGVSVYNKFLHKNDWRTKADPETYLRNEMYENEYK